MSGELVGKLLEVTTILKKAEQREIERRRCFVVSRAEFYRIYELLPETGQSDLRVGHEGWDNYEIILTVADRAPYLICTKAEPICDALWKPKETVE